MVDCICRNQMDGMTFDVRAAPSAEIERQPAGGWVFEFAYETGYLLNTDHVE